MKILITLDGSKFAEEVLAPAAELAARSGAEVHLLEVVREPGTYPVRSDSYSPTFEEALRAEYHWPWGAPMASPEHPVERGVAVETATQAGLRTYTVAKDYLDGVARRFFHGQVKTEVLMGHDPAEEIMSYARNYKADLIALATHGRTGLARMLMGSVAHRLLRAQVAPLFLVRPHKLHGGEG